MDQAGPGRRLREALPGLLPHFRPLRAAIHRGGSALGRHGRQPVARIHGGFRRRRRFRGASARAAAMRPIWRRPSPTPAPPAAADPEGDLAPEEFHTPGPQDHRRGGRVHRPARDLADEEPGAGGRRQAGAGAAARRSSAERNQIRRRGERSGVPPGAARRDRASGSAPRPARWARSA